MLLAHGTTERNADLIESRGYFDSGSYFLKLLPDPKAAIFGAAGFALRHHPATQEYVDKYCQQDLLLQPLKSALLHSAQKYLCRKGDDRTPGIIYIVDAPKEVLTSDQSIIRAFFVPSEVITTQPIATSAVQNVLTLDEHLEHFQGKYGRICEPLQCLSVDHLAKRLFNTAYSRWLRLVE